MKFDRGFIKWQPFHSVVNLDTLVKSLLDQETQEKPILAEDELLKINELIMDAYYSKSNIILTFYEENKIKTIKTSIIKLNFDNHTILLNNYKTIFFNQIIHIH